MLSVNGELVQYGYILGRQLQESQHSNNCKKQTNKTKYVVCRNTMCIYLQGRVCSKRTVFLYSTTAE